jgi:hypothetical protein
LMILTIYKILLEYYPFYQVPNLLPQNYHIIFLWLKISSIYFYLYPFTDSSFSSICFFFFLNYSIRGLIIFWFHLFFLVFWLINVSLYYQCYSFAFLRSAVLQRIVFTFCWDWNQKTRLFFFPLEKFHDVLLTRLSTQSGKGFHDPLSINPCSHSAEQIYF